MPGAGSSEGLMRIGGVASLALIIALTAFLCWRYLAPAASDISSAETQPRVRTSEGIVRIPSSHDVPTTPARVPAVDYKKLYDAAQNYWDVAHAALPAAKAGNAEAQFYLSRVIEQCEIDNKMFFRRRGQTLSLDEGLQLAANRNVSVALAQTIFERCHQFLTSDATELGSSSEWLAKATRAGQPLAEATTASKILLQTMMQNFARDGGVPNQDPKPELESGADPRTLFYQAVKSKDAEVMFMIGEAQGLLYPSRSDTDVTRFAWWLVACQRGFDCTADGRFVKQACAEFPDCQSAAGPTDLVRSASQDKWPEVQQRALEISTMLDAGQWDELVPARSGASESDNP
jgi:hypothetical protein